MASAQGAKQQAPEAAQRQLIAEMQNRADKNPTQVASSVKAQGRKVDLRDSGQRGAGEGEKQEHPDDQPEPEARDEAAKAPADKVGQKLDIRM